MTKAEVYKDIFVILITLTFILSIIKIVIAQPNLPNQFYGSIKCPDGSNFPDGFLLAVKVQGTQIKSTSIVNGVYGYSPLFLIWEAQEDSTLDFYVSDIYYTSTTFSPGTTQNLNITTTSCPEIVIAPTPSNNGGGGGGGGGSGGGGSPNNNSNKNKTNPKSPPPKGSLLFNSEAQLLQEPLDLIAPTFSNYLGSPIQRSPPIIALDISILSLLVLSLAVLIAYNKLRNKSKHNLGLNT